MRSSLLGRLRSVLGTLRARVVIAATGAILVAVALFAAATVLFVGDQLRGSLDQALRKQAEQVAELAVSAPAVLTEPGALESSSSGRLLEVEVIDSHGRLIARSETLGARLLPLDTLARGAIRRGTTGFENVHLDGQPYRLFAAPIAQAGGPAAGGAVLVAADISDISDTLNRLGLVLSLSGAGAALLAAIAAAALTRRGLRPLRRLAAGAAEIERTADPSRRLPEAGAADEVGALTGVLNRMLASLDEARAGERRFLADASHELRTPVTALRGNVEYVARHGLDPEVLADLRHDAARLSQLVDDLLVLERAGASVPPGGREPVELDAIVRELAIRDRVVAGPVEPAAVRGDRDALTRALSNFVDNGLVHGPPDSPVTVSLKVRSDTALVTVADQGPGPAPEDRERLFERFWRAADAAPRPGSGLGLSIAQAIVEQHGGRIAVDGSRFTVELPVISDPEARGRSGSGR